MKRNSIILVFGVVFGPAVLLLHECGHYVSISALGLTPHFHFAQVTTSYPRGVTPRDIWPHVVTGPTVEAILGVVGFIWLWRRRRNRKQEPADALDWLATFLALCLARWLRCITGTPTHPQPKDEATLSLALGLPQWFLPYSLAPIALMLLIAVIRLHPPGSRLYPFGSALLGLSLGAALWLWVLGPRVLP